MPPSILFLTNLTHTHTHSYCIKYIYHIDPFATFLAVVLWSELYKLGVCNKVASKLDHTLETDLLSVILIAIEHMVVSFHR